MATKKRTVIPFDNLPARPPILATVVAYMGLDLYGASEVWWGIFGTIAVLMWLGFVISVCGQTFKKLPGYGEGE